VVGGPPEQAWPSSIPELKTSRLRLRAPLPQDATAVLSIFRDPRVTEYHSMPTLTTMAEAQAALERAQQRFVAKDAIRWAIDLAESGEMIGSAGLLRFDFEHRHAEVGYEIARPHWGQGLAPEAVAAVIRYGFSVLGLRRIEAGVLPGNEASVRVLQKLGFLEEGTRRDYLYAKGRFHSFRWFSLLATDTERAL
jgi:RimJ/RimL family protein N-acetyltransferase